MVPYFGDFVDNATVYIPFNTFDSNDPSASVTITNLADADIMVHENGGTTQAVTDGATVAINFDGITGNHLITIDTSADAFYNTGADYMVRIEGTTVDAATINAWVGSFSIENRSHIAPLSDIESALVVISSETTVLQSDSIIIESSVQVIESQTTVIESDSITIQSSLVVVESQTTVIESSVQAVEVDTGNIYSDTTIITDTDGVILGAAGVDLIWDEVLTGATHNVVNSAGRRIRQIQEAGGYSGGRVYVDTVNGAAGTTAFENGTDVNPVNSFASALTIAAALPAPISTFHIATGSTITLAATLSTSVLLGENWILALGGQSIDGSVFVGAAVTGVATNATGTQHFERCEMGAVTIPGDTHLIACDLSGTITAGEAGDFFIEDCHSSVAGTGTVTFDFGAALNSSNLNVRHHSGGFTIENMGAGTGTYNASFEGFGQIIWAASCSATSNASIRGHWTITDSASGAVTETLDDVSTTLDSVSSQTTVIESDSITIQSSLVVVESQTTVIESNTEAIHSQTTVIESDSITVQSSLVVVESQTTVIESNTEAIHSQTTVIESDSITVQSSLVVVESQTTVIESNTEAIHSQTTVIESDSITIQSSLVVVESQTTVIESQTTVMESGLITGLTEGTPSTTVIQTDLAEATDDHYIGRIIVFTDGVAAFQATDITDYTGATGTVTVTALTTAPGAGDAFTIY